MKSKTSWMILLIAMVAFLLPNVCLSKNERRIALVIGNGNYTHGGSLSNPVNDARSIQRALEGLGFTVLKFENCSQKTMKKVIDRFGRKLKNYDVGLFFYAGHGVQVKSNNYLIPVDAKLDDENDAEYDCVRAGRILAKMESAGTRTNIVILDACRDNPFERSWQRGVEGSGLAFMNAPSGSLIAYSTSPGKTAFDGKDTNSPYTSALLKHINSPDITIIKMFQNVRSTVRTMSSNKQTPWESTSLSGDFYFNSGSGVVTVKRPSSDQTDGLIEERAKLERDRRELEQMELEIERKKLEEKRKRLEAEKKKLAVAKRPPAEKKPGDTWTDPVTGMEFVFVPGGCYQMGSSSGDSDEKPVHEVCVDGFWMGKFEVTRGQFRRFIQQTRYKTDADKKGTAWISNKETEWRWKKMPGYNWEKTGYSQTDSHPVSCVSWNDAKAFAGWLSRKTGKKFALPAEAQWEYAARAGTNTLRFWGDTDSDACKYANAADKGSGWNNSFPCNDGYEFTAPAGTFKANPFDLYDMLGNVWEWCEDIYDKNAYSKHSHNNPLVTSGGSSRVCRGGSWFLISRYMRAANRLGYPADDRNNYLGFRLCLSQVRQQGQNQEQQHPVRMSHTIEWAKWSGHHAPGEDKRFNTSKASRSILE